ncbi:hypothetical protein AAKU55_004832 [Oxalobacteraceae bacterium GrIS 1.11]
MRADEVSNEVANEVAADDVLACLAQVEALVGARRGAADPQRELALLGLTPEDAGPLWDGLGEPAWRALLRAVARTCPQLGWALALLRRGHEADAAAPDGQPRPSDIPLLLTGILERLWQEAAAHAENRPLFRRHLADFPAIRWRLIMALAHVLRAERIGLAMPGPGHAAALRRAARAVRVDTQQICGGSGYMLESAFAGTLLWCERCCAALPPGAGQLKRQEIAEIDAHVARRLTAAGLPPELVTTLLQCLPQVT